MAASSPKKKGGGGGHSIKSRRRKSGGGVVLKLKKIPSKLDFFGEKDRILRKYTANMNTLRSFVTCKLFDQGLRCYLCTTLYGIFPRSTGLGQRRITLG